MASLLQPRPHFLRAISPSHPSYIYTSIRTLKADPKNGKTFSPLRSTKTVPKKTLPRHAGPPLRKKPLEPFPTSTPPSTLPPPSPPSSETPSSHPYHITRTKSGQLPIYIEAKAGGTKKQTRIRKIEGDIRALANEVEIFLRQQAGAEAREGDVKVDVNFLTGHVIVKGFRKKELEGFLVGRNF